jgi:hypothetical protein
VPYHFSTWLCKQIPLSKLNIIFEHETMDKAHKSNNPRFVYCQNLYDRCISKVMVKVVAYHAVEGTEGEYRYGFTHT